MAKPADEPKKPIKFKDAVGRKFSFPFHLCATWAGMEQIINAAFENVEALAPQVRNGNYDLINSNGEIILPQVWETIIEPGWAITMHVWHMPTTFSGSLAPPSLGLLQSGAQIAGGSGSDPDSPGPDIDVDVDAQAVMFEETNELPKETTAKPDASQKPLRFKDAVG
ncbi:hypothetical protein B0J14DRAFT_474347 [Halenospora varia]|nr:hypothetical protein B0J14DRAFT_474347 [Halenospora varia]